MRRSLSSTKLERTFQQSVDAWTPFSSFATQDKGQPALWLAVRYGRLDVVRHVLSIAGEQLSVCCTRDHTTSLHVAASLGNVDILSQLLKSDSQLDTSCIEMRDNSGATALIWSCLKGHTECAKALIDSGADVNATDAQGATALMHSAKLGHFDLCQVLLDAGADATLRDSKQRSAMDRAASEAIRVLFKPKETY